MDIAGRVIDSIEATIIKFLLQVKLFSSWMDNNDSRCSLAYFAVDGFFFFFLGPSCYDYALNVQWPTLTQCWDNNIIIWFIWQVEKILYVLTEFTSTVEHQKDSLEEMEKTITFIAKLVVSLLKPFPLLPSDFLVYSFSFVCLFLITT